jgi:HD-GYP domain-containing protein (c-di-GMP phosphodiesterase class II)
MKGSDKARLKEIIDLSTEISRTNDIDVLLDKILTKARALTGADAGSIYIKEDGRLTFKCAQNETLQKQLGPGRKLIHTRFFLPLDSACIASHVARSGHSLNIPDAYHLPPGASYVFNPEFDRISDYRTISVLTLPLPTYHDTCGVLQLINAKTRRGAVVPFSRDMEQYVLYFANSAAVAVERAQLTRSIVLRMIKMAELHDPKETGGHVNRVAGYAIEIYEAWANRRGIPADEIERNKDILRIASMLHDIGKIGIPNTILKKRGRLDASEFEAIKEHSRLGAQLFLEKQSDVDSLAFVVACNHHERWDGNGYPGHIDVRTGKPLGGHGEKLGRARGKRREEIPLLARIVSVADVYDALCSARCYKEAYDQSRALEVIRSESGKAFDPEVVEAFFAALHNLGNVLSQYPETS